jgi:hypothetical protein
MATKAPTHSPESLPRVAYVDGARQVVVWLLPTGIAGVVAALAWLWGRTRSEAVEIVLRRASAIDADRESKPAR